MPWLVAAYAAAVLALDPFRAGLPDCPFHAVTGLHCPGCGSTRATYLLLHGDVAGALAMNALVLPALVLVLAKPLQPKVPPLAVAVTFAAFAVARNVAPFAALAP